MFTLRGKYTSAHIMTDQGVEQEATSQIYNVLNHPAFKGTYISIMPDVHAGAGCVIGYTQTMNNYIVANLVGVDIGCGIDAYNLGQQNIDFESLDSFIRENIPSGFHVRGKPLELSTQLSEQIKSICDKIEKADEHRAKASMGTLGGGNHFIELNKDPKGNVWLAIHSGSRKFGLDIAVYHQQRAKALMKEMFIGDAYKQLEFLPIDKGGQEYLDDMMVAQQYAYTNRRLMAKVIMEDYFGLDVDHGEQIKSVHNYINFEDNIVRKGAIAAHEGQRVIIPLNMRDGSIIGTGRGNTQWNLSAPHGAGRIMSRKKAKEQFTVEEFEEEMEGVWTSCISQKTLDESPMAYKDKQIILDVIDETVDVEFIMKPIYNFKASS
jgi:RNA-splicing ligase RtcB